VQSLSERIIEDHDDLCSRCAGFARALRRVTWVETHGRKPRTGERPLLVRYRNGLESKHTYTVRQIARWSHTGDDWDIMAVARA
jgi:hypothetical protein